MANNYTESSFTVDNLTPADIEWWKKEENRYGMFGDKIPYSTDWELNENVVWFHSDECINVDTAASVIQRFLQECRPNGFVGFTWSETCSKPRVGEFGGGACLVTGKHIQWLSAYDWLQEQAAAFERRGETCPKWKLRWHCKKKEMPKDNVLSHAELVERFTNEVLMLASGKSLARIWNENCDEQVEYNGDDQFTMKT